MVLKRGTVSKVETKSLLEESGWKTRPLSNNRAPPPHTHKHRITQSSISHWLQRILLFLLLLLILYTYFVYYYCWLTRLHKFHSTYYYYYIPVPLHTHARTHTHTHTCTTRDRNGPCAESTQSTTYCKSQSLTRHFSTQSVRNWLPHPASIGILIAVFWVSEITMSTFCWWSWSDKVFKWNGTICETPSHLPLSMPTFQ